jgi:hypothetical protein
MGGPKCRQLPTFRHKRARSLIGAGTHRSDAVGAGTWGWTSAGIHEEDTALETRPRRVTGAGSVSHPVAF